MLPVPSLLQPLLAAPVAVFGAGVSGRGVQALVEALGGAAVVYDAKDTPFTARTAAQHRLAVFSPGFAPEHPWLALARSAGMEAMGELDFAALNWHGRIVAITGTNGKTTLTEFLTEALRAAGRPAHATGNIGHSFSQLVVEGRGGQRDDFAVCEVSSFQAETLRHLRADGLLWTNFAEDHLERHRTLDSYFAAKWSLLQRTSGFIFVGTSVQQFAEKFGRPLPAGTALATLGQGGDPRLAETVFADYPQRENFLLAAAWWKEEGLPPAALYTAARRFRLGRHRLARVAEIEGVTFWNDSKATNFHAVEAALSRFSAPVILIAGGRAKGGDFAGFVHRIAPKVKHMVLIGETRADLAFHCSAFRVAHTLCGSLEEAFRRAEDLAEPGDHVLLSPAFASFDMFRNYEDRGNQFEQLVRGEQAAATLR